MPQEKFLEQIAEYYTDGSRIDRLSDITFIFPNKRSANFLQFYIEQRLKGEFALMPRFSTFRRFAFNMSNMVDSSRFEQLFLLYKTYVEVEAEHNPESAAKNQFDKFIFWGDMILDDFDLIDSSLADAEKIYANLKGIKEIATDYLNDDQKAVITRIWGTTALNRFSETQDFWRHIEKNIDSDNKKHRNLFREFVAHWEILGEVYRRFRAVLIEHGISTAGMQLRRAYDIIKDTPVEKLRRRIYVFVGHANLTHAEIAIMQRLKEAGCARFFWDLASPLFYDSGRPDTTNHAVAFITSMAKEFPMPDDFCLAPVETTPHIDIYGVASSVMQTKMAGKIIGDLKLNAATAFNTAIVVPDPSQLMPLMLSLPKLVETDPQGKEKPIGVNITSGLSYSNTTFSTLFNAIIALQRNSRMSRNKRLYFFNDVLEVLLHPHIQLVAGGEAGLLRQYISDRNLFNIEASMILDNFPGLAFIFRPINRLRGDEYLADTVSCATYIENVIEQIKERLSRIDGFDDSFELLMLNYFAERVQELKALIEKFQIEMHDTTFLSLFERIMMSKKITLDGTPLAGLQVMGVLETRCLDFDNIIFLSMNERSLPRKEYVSTMIPNNLRRGYGLPAIEQTESFYSYYFFRAIGRASRVALLYDTRPPGKGRGEMSRYIEQILHRYKNENITHNLMDMSGVLPDKRTIGIKKTDKVMERLNRFLEPTNGRNLSASSLKKYLECPLKFYLMVVVGLSDENEPTDYLDAAEVGDIFHRSAQAVFDHYREKNKPVLITLDIVDDILSSGIIDKVVDDEVAHTIGIDTSQSSVIEFTSEGVLVGDITKKQLRQMFEAEKRNIEANGPFTYFDGEYEVKSPQWKVGDYTFNFHMLIDRIDRIDADTLRFIDYKTGKDESKAASIDEVFSGDYKKAAIFQLLTYAAAFEALRDNKSSINLSLYVIRNLMSEGTIEPITIGGISASPDKSDQNAIEQYRQLREEFYVRFEQLIDDIFNRTTDFVQCDDVNRCKLCPFISVCGRVVPLERKVKKRKY